MGKEKFLFPLCVSSAGADCQKQLASVAKGANPSEMAGEAGGDGRMVKRGRGE